MPNTDFALNLFRTPSVSRQIFEYFDAAQMALAEGGITNEDVKNYFMEKFASKDLPGLMGKPISKDTINWDRVYEEMKADCAPTYISKVMIREKLEKRRLDPNDIDFLGWNLNITPEEETKWNERNT